MTHYISVAQALRIAELVTGGVPEIRDVGLLESALRRPRASVLGEDAYPDLLGKAGALLHSLVRNHALVDGNKRLAWLATWVFCAKNGIELDPSDDEAFDLVVAIAAGDIDDAGAISERLRSFAKRED